MWFAYAEPGLGAWVQTSAKPLCHPTCRTASETTLRFHGSLQTAVTGFPRPDLEVVLYGK